MRFAHVIMTCKTSNSQLYIGMMSCLLMGWHVNISPALTVCEKTLQYLVHVSICATSHPLDELKVMLGVSPLDFTAWAGEDVHGSSIQMTLSHI